MKRTRPLLNRQERGNRIHPMALLCAMRVICRGGSGARLAAALVLLWTGGLAPSVFGQQANVSPASLDGHKTLRAIRTTTPIKLDGELDDAAWREAASAGDFIQSEPYEGRPATERTEVKVVYNEENLYIGVYCYDQESAKIIVNSLKKDFGNVNSDTFELILDTFQDARNGYFFATNPQGAKRDVQVSDEGRTINQDWDTVWDVRAKMNGDGWTAEIVIPFKSLSFDENRSEQVWGINFARRIRRKNEVDFWAPIPRRYEISRLSLAGQLQGLEEVHRGRNLRVKPYVVGDLTKFAARDYVVRRSKQGLDAKYNVTPSLTLDLTLNTDFSQVEVDEQQINLTRFSLFFPEKREFFLENDGIFQFGDIPLERGPNRSKETQLFFSRRIGLSDDGTPVPIWGGVRLSGQIGKYSLGLLEMQTKPRAKGIPGDNFGVARIKRNILANSDIGAIFANRQASEGKDFSRTAGGDANFRFGQNYTVNGYLAKTKTDGVSGQDLAKKVSTQWRDNLSRLQVVYTDLGKNFNPEVGFTQRTGTRFVRVRTDLHPRPKPNRFIREFYPHYGITYFMDTDNRTLTKDQHYALEIGFQDGSRAEAHYDPQFDRLDKPFEIRRRPVRPEITIPAGDYHFGYWSLEYTSDQSKKLAGDVVLEKGSFYSGDRTTLNLSGIVRPNYHFVVEPRYSINNVTLENVTVNGVPGGTGSFTTHLLSSRFSYYFSTRMYLSALVQYNTDRRQVTSNIRFNFIHRPLSDLFLVYNEQRDVSGARRTDKGFTIKYTHLLSF